MFPMDEALEAAKCVELEKIIVEDDSEKFFQVRAQLPPWEKEELIMFLKRNIDMFTWSAYEAPGVDPNFILLGSNTLGTKCIRILMCNVLANHD